MNYNKHTQSGFGLVEVLISAVIIATMLGAAVSLGNLGINRTVMAQNKIVANQIASSAIEDCVAIRNRAYLTGKEALNGNSLGSDAGIPSNNNYVLTIEQNLPKITPTNANPVKILPITSTNNVQFYRKIGINRSESGLAGTSLDTSLKATKITVTITWREAGIVSQDNKVVQSIVLTDWQNAN